ncbi:magnesium transporter [Shewanella salipaludis]|uniref:Magnesium transporter n=1 Tax=Shewanella salipaludis TaxID=2723052 RepID=A0A972JKH0_9GAMM|nr:magnesium transporter [Shewanella salipaludis]NMH64357.1 magnesium transporter [Shewanella salipaludis]
MNSANLRLSIHYMTIEPQAAARQLELLPAGQGGLLLQQAPTGVAARVLQAMLPDFAAKILPLLTDGQNSKLIQELSLTDVAAIFRYLPGDARRHLLPFLPQGKQALCKMLLNYPEYTVGALVETDVLMLDSKMSIAEALLRLKRRNYAYLQWLYLVNASRRLEGRVGIGDLFRHPPMTLIAGIMSKPGPRLNAATELQTALALDIWQGQDTVAVINRRQEFIGVLHHHHLRNLVRRQQRADTRADAIPAELLELYGDTLVSLAELFSSSKTRESLN